MLRWRVQNGILDLSNGTGVLAIRVPGPGFRSAIAAIRLVHLRTLIEVIGRALTEPITGQRAVGSRRRTTPSAAASPTGCGTTGCGTTSRGSESTDGSDATDGSNTAGSTRATRGTGATDSGRHVDTADASGGFRTPYRRACG